ncbi:regulatory helix-turn-helix protein, lysR family [Chitinophaga costaii]|uniref:Regulatory helix-turn-helix protein, lysR family n=1 Tax=Chitinophaga costaii TaxID=1335309 RepID=A0A1C4BKG2_9BACT|nr:LysR family transcriptional regulator [Chitinophaga costaii]SCC07303.1 regulatory helix-turn-helix protein, lysR family [Chitinophaga costaii]
MVNLEWYRSFKAIYKTGTFTGAAEMLFVSQPDISLHYSYGCRAKANAFPKTIS